MALDASTTNDFEDLLASIDSERRRISRELDPASRNALGQFLTPPTVARQLAAMMDPCGNEVRILDPGAGIGALGAALVVHLLTTRKPPLSIALHTYEIAEPMWSGLDRTMQLLHDACDEAGVSFTSEVVHEDFLTCGVNKLDENLFSIPAEPYDAAILNPPYRKISSSSPERSLCQRIGLETTNLYTAFLAVSAGLLREGGQLAAIVPRSFTNGTYFRPFREWFSRSMVFDRIHVFESRRRAFADDGVLQENVLLAATRSRTRPDHVTVTSSADPADPHPTYRQVPYGQLVSDDHGHVIHLVPDQLNHEVASRVASLPCELADLGLTVSTGRVVDFRVMQYLRSEPGAHTVPLIYPAHLREGRIRWPMTSGRKPNALIEEAKSADLLVPEGLYVLTKRFSSKEERRRIVAAIYDPVDVRPGWVGFENHLNYFHHNGAGMDRRDALGLRAYLNSTLVDLYFRQFSGHTQVNAGDLRRLRYPSREQLWRLAARVGDAMLDQTALDHIIDEELFALAGKETSDPVRAHRRIEEAIALLRAIGLPRGQLNERSGLTLLALLNLGPDDPWAGATNPPRGITPMMDYFRDCYGKTYAPNTRETVRRQTVHQFLDAGLVITNPDLPDRPVNSPKAVYQIEPSALELVRTYGTPQWSQHLETYLASRETLRQKYAAERAMTRIPVTLPDGRELTLSGGGQNVLILKVIDEFCPRWIPGGVVRYVGDADEKFVLNVLRHGMSLGYFSRSTGRCPTSSCMTRHGVGWC